MTPADDTMLSPFVALGREHAFAKAYAAARLAAASKDFEEALRWKRELAAALTQVQAEAVTLKAWVAERPQRANEDTYHVRRIAITRKQMTIQKELARARDAVVRLHNAKDAEARQTRPIQGFRHWRQDNGVTQAFVWLGPVPRDAVRSRADVGLVFDRKGRLVGIELCGEACGVALEKGEVLSGDHDADSPYDQGYADGFRAAREAIAEDAARGA